MNGKIYALNGFRLVTVLDANGLNYAPQAAVAITKGQVLFDDGAGFATNVGTAFAATFMGIAMADSDNSGGAAGDVTIAYRVPQPHDRWMVKNESATVAAATDRGEIIDLDSNDGVDVTDVTCVSWGFFVEAIDISSDATTAIAGGFVIGRFVRIGA